MLNLLRRSSLYFPKLKYDMNVEFNKGNRAGSKGTTALFSLDWTEKEKVTKQKHNNQWPDKEIPFISDLPKKWDEMVKEKRFAIPDHYLREVQNQSQLAFVEWNSRYPFDTNIREMCLISAQAHTEIAFKLVADCVYDTETKYYSRKNEDRYFLDHLLIYKFWSHQTGRGLLWRRAKLNEVEWFLDHRRKELGYDKLEPNECAGDSETSMLERFLEDMKKHNEILNKAYDVLTQDMPREFSDKVLKI